MTCNRCENTGFLNLHQIDDDTLEDFYQARDREIILKWIREQIVDHDVAVCDCCGDGESWYGEPGEHFAGEPEGTYDHNGGLPECN